MYKIEDLHAGDKFQNVPVDIITRLSQNVCLSPSQKTVTITISHRYNPFTSNIPVEVDGFFNNRSKYDLYYIPVRKLLTFLNRNSNYKLEEFKVVQIEYLHRNNLTKYIKVDKLDDYDLDDYVVVSSISDTYALAKIVGVLNIKFKGNYIDTFEFFDRKIICKLPKLEN